MAVVEHTTLCECGCGQPAPIAGRTRRELGHVKGLPLRFINGHNGVARNIERSDPQPFDVVDAGHDTPCWLWQRHTTTQGYARLTVEGARRAGHVVYYERAIGPVPDGLELDHLCRNRSCVRPDHLEAVTHAENIRRSPMGKVTSEELAQIRVAQGTDSEVAARFGLSRCYVNRVRRGLVA